MRKNIYALPLAMAVFAMVGAGCKKDEDDNPPSNDARVRRILLDEYKEYVFVINDIEGKIYNYDSLPLGSRVDSLLPYFYGYSNSVLGVMTSREGTDTLKPYDGLNPKEALDFTKPVTIVTTAEDKTTRKSYTMEVRVHKYDVDAFRWIETGIVGAKEKNESQGSLMAGGEYCWYVRTDEGSKVWKSKDGKEWRSEDMAGYEYDFASLCEADGKVYCGTADGKLLVSEDGTAFAEVETGGVAMDKVLFAIDGKIWAIGGDSLYAYKDTMKGVCALPSDFPKDGVISPFAAQSGYTTIGYVLATKGEKSEVWGVDKMGNVMRLGGEGLPYLTDACIFNFENILGVIGGRDKDGVLQSVCYASTDGGLNWKSDWHKDLGEQVGAIAEAGLFVTNRRGEMILVGGETKGGYEGKVYTCRLKKLIQEEEYFNSIK